MLSAFLHPSLRNPKSGLKYRIRRSWTIYQAQHVLDMDAQSSCMDQQQISLPNRKSPLNSALGTRFYAYRSITC